MIFGEDELVLYDDGEGIKSGGYSVDSDMLRRRAPAMYTMNGGSSDGSSGSSGSSVSDIFADLVVPAGLYLNGGAAGAAGAGDKSDCAQCGEHTVLPDDIYDTLLKHAEVRSSRAAKPTRKHGSAATKRKTRRAPK